MSVKCKDCGAVLEIPNDAVQGEIIGCPDCGLDYAVVKDKSSSLRLQQIIIEGEDWGE